MDNKELLEQCNSDYDSFSEYRNSLVEGELKVSEGLDKAVLAIASAALGLTFTLYGKYQVAGNEDSIIYIQLSWIFLAFSMFFVLTSLLVSGHLYYLNRNKVDKLLENRANIIESINNEDLNRAPLFVFSEYKKLSMFARFSHYSGAVALFIGVVAFGFFVNQNLGVQIKDVKENKHECSVELFRGQAEGTGTTTATAATSTKKEGINDYGKKSSTTTSTETSETSEEVKVHKLP